MQIDTRNILSQHQSLTRGDNNSIVSTHRIDLGPIDDITDRDVRRMSKGLHYIPARRENPAAVTDAIPQTNPGAPNDSLLPGVNVRRRVGRTGDIPLLITLSTDLPAAGGSNANRAAALVVDFMHADTETGVGEPVLRCAVALEGGPGNTNILRRRYVFPVQFIPREITRRYFFLRYTAQRSLTNDNGGRFSAGNITATIASAVHAGYSGTGR